MWRGSAQATWSLTSQYAVGGSNGPWVQIRQHLIEEATRFSDGDFSDPEAIHGSAMPGLATLKARFDEIDVELSETDAGAAIVYTAQDPDVITAIHLWFAAQTSDHGRHAEHNS